MSMERAFINEIGLGSYRTKRINHILKTLGLGDLKEGVMILSYAGIPIYLVSEYDMDQIYMTIIDTKHRNGESREDIDRWLASQPIEIELKHRLSKQLAKSA